MQGTQTLESADDDCIEIKSEPADTVPVFPVHIFTCAHCDAKFQDAREFEQHVMTHKTYLCCFCDLPFAEKHQLLKHLQQHEIFANQSIVEKNSSKAEVSRKKPGRPRKPRKNAKKENGLNEEMKIPKETCCRGKNEPSIDEKQELELPDSIRSPGPDRIILKITPSHVHKSHEKKDPRLEGEKSDIPLSYQYLPTLVEYAMECEHSSFNHNNATTESNEGDQSTERSAAEILTQLETSIADSDLTSPNTQGFSTSPMSDSLSADELFRGSDAEKVDVTSYHCDVCELLFTSLTALADHWQQDHSANNMNICYECYRAFDSEPSLQQHRESYNHFGFTCHICSERFNKQTSLKNHLTTHRSTADKSTRLNEDPLTCAVCGKSFSSRALCRVHIRRQHGSTRFTCSVCGQRFVRRDKLRKHELTHSSGFRCVPCNESFDERWKLIQHRKRHVIDRNFPCSQCPMSFATAGNLHRHQEVHSDSRPHVCDVCSKSFKRLNHLKRHQLGHLEQKPHPCHLCDKSFVRKPHLDRHILIHTRKWQCKECPEIFDSRTALSDHVTSNHHEQLHVCEHCGVTFAQRSYWRKHLKNVHNKGDPRFSCPSCPKEFFSRPDLAKHLRVHTGEKPFACSSCDKAFSQAGALIRHKRIHTGERPYLCSTCGRSFSDQSHYKRHLKIHAAGRVINKRSEARATNQVVSTAKHDLIDLQPVDDMKQLNAAGHLKHLAAAADLFEMTHRNQPLDQPITSAIIEEEPKHTPITVDQSFSQPRLLHQPPPPPPVASQYTGAALPFVFPSWQHK